MKKDYNKNDILELLNTKVIGKNLLFFDTILSTNDYLKQNYSECAHGTVVVTKSQTGGRGRRGNIWENSENESVFMSILFKPNVKVYDLLRISLVSSLSIIQALEMNDSNIDLKIKWPNDILIGDKKVCGILTECINNDICGVKLIIGIGVNVNNENFSSEIENKATSMFLNGVNTTVPMVIANIITKMEKNYYTYLQYGFQFFINEYKKYCCNINREVMIIKGQEKIYGKVIDINDDGTLLFKNDLGEVSTLLSNEVSVRGLNGYI